MITVVEYRGERPPTLNGPKGVKRMHFHTYTRVRKRWEMLLKMKYPFLEIPTPSRLTFTVFSSVLLDWENACVIMKVPMDALQNNGNLAEDNPKHIVSCDLRQEKCARKDVGFRMEFEEVKP